MKENCYQTLSVAEDATADVISAAYKALAKLHHPDSGTDKRDWKLMAKINEAFETLSNKEKRAEHDRLLQEERGKRAKRSKKQKRLKLAIIPVSFLAGLLIAFFLIGNTDPEPKTTSLVAIDSMLAEAKKDLAARENRIAALNDDLVELEKQLADKDAENEKIKVEYTAQASEQNFKIGDLEARVGMLGQKNQDLATELKIRTKQLDAKVKELAKVESALAQAESGSEESEESFLPQDSISIEDDPLKVVEVADKVITDDQRITALEDELTKLREALDEIVESSLKSVPKADSSSTPKQTESFAKNISGAPTPEKKADEISPRRIADTYFERGLKEFRDNKWIEAYAEFNVSAALGSTEATEYRKFAQRRLSPQDLENAQKLSEEIFSELEDSKN